MSRRSLAALVLVMAACGPVPRPPEAATPSPPYAAAIATLCDVNRLAKLSPDEEPLAVGQKRSQWVAAQTDNPDAIEFETRMSVKGAAEQGEMLREEALAVGLRHCALADALEHSGMGGRSPNVRPTGQVLRWGQVRASKVEPRRSEGGTYPYAANGVEVAEGQ